MSVKVRHVVLLAKTSRTSMTLLRRNDVRKFDADAILFREMQCKKMDILMFKRRFQCGLVWILVKYARITITHVCFIALTLAGSLTASCPNNFLGTRQMIMHAKTCVIPILYKYYIP